MMKEEPSDIIEVVTCNFNSQDYCSTSPIVSATTDSSPVTLPTPIDSKDDDNLLLCLEEVSYQDESEEEESLPGMVSGGQCIMVMSDPGSTPYHNYIPSTPNNAILFSPNTPWLTGSSPQVFTSNFSSPPMQPQPTRLHHLSPLSNPVVPMPNVYSPCLTLPTSPRFFPATMYGGQEFHHWGIQQ